MTTESTNNNGVNKLHLVRLGIDTQFEFIVYMHKDCFVCKSEGFEALKQVIVNYNNFFIIATLNIIQSDALSKHEISLSESAWQRLGAKEGEFVTLSHLNPVTSLKYLRSKIYGHEIKAAEFQQIILDIIAGKYSNIQLASSGLSH